jgi:DNA-directed RNA polymerase specialized sigma24 family protein
MNVLEFVEETHEELVKFAKFQLRKFNLAHLDPEDFVHESLINVFNKQDSIAELTRYKLRAYMRVSILNLIRTQRKVENIGRVRPYTEADEKIDPQTNWENTDLKLTIHNIRKNASPIERKLIDARLAGENTRNKEELGVPSTQWRRLKNMKGDKNA